MRLRLKHMAMQHPMWHSGPRTRPISVARTPRVSNVSSPRSLACTESPLGWICQDTLSRCERIRLPLCTMGKIEARGTHPGFGRGALGFACDSGVSPSFIVFGFGVAQRLHSKQSWRAPRGRAVHSGTAEYYLRRILFQCESGFASGKKWYAATTAGGRTDSARAPDPTGSHRNPVDANRSCGIVPGKLHQYPLRYGRQGRRPRRMRDGPEVHDN
jgi:hypothetical protein